jgi:hypothetical protein
MSDLWKQRYPISDVLTWIQDFRHDVLGIQSLQIRFYAISDLVDTDIPREVWRAVLSAPEHLEIIRFTVDTEREKDEALQVLAELERRIQET